MVLIVLKRSRILAKVNFLSGELKSDVARGKEKASYRASVGLMCRLLANDSMKEPAETSQTVPTPKRQAQIYCRFLFRCKPNKKPNRQSRQPLSSQTICPS